MDSVTHIVLGACIAEVMVGKALRQAQGAPFSKRVLLAGAVAQSLPDIDFVASFWLDPANDLLAHRGFTHSILFVVLVAPALALITDRYLIPGKLALRKWIVFYLVQVFVHIFLDAFNAYGTGWFEPFSHDRISFNVLFVADPFFTLPLAVACGLLVLWKTDDSRRWKFAMLAITCSYLYLATASWIKSRIDSVVEANFELQGMPVSKYFTTPTPLNSLLWFVVANNEQGSYIGYRSIFDDADPIYFEFVPRNELLLDPISDHEDLQHLKRFSNGYYAAEQWGDTLVFNDLRFGKQIGWRDPWGHFVFHYYLNHPADNDLVVQRGRFEGWDSDAARSLFVRALGNRTIDRELPVENRR